MKILYLAFACNPYAGSEAYCGWAWPSTMRNLAEVYLVTRRENRESIERYIQENQITNLRVFYHDIPSWMNVYYKTKRLYHLYYLIWQKTSVRLIRKLNKAYRFDYIHQVTLGDFRSINGSCRLSDTKFIFGPVGGAQSTPKAFSEYVKNNAKSERIRDFINRMLCLSPTYRSKLNHAKWVFAANPETQRYLQRLMKNPERCRLLTENGIYEQRLCPKMQSDSVEQTQPDNTKVSLLWVGRVVNKKGLSFLLDVLHEVKTSTVYELTIIGDGPERPYLEGKTEQLGLNEQVRFVGGLPYEQVQEFYKKADIFVFPSFRETTGTVLFEAMSHELPVITFNQNGAALLVSEQTGRKIDVDQGIDVIRRDFSAAIQELVDHAMTRKKLGSNAYELMRETYTWENKCKNFYAEILNA